MKRNLKLGLVILSSIALLATGCGKSSNSSKSKELRMNVTTSESSVWMTAAKEFKKEVEEKTKGRYKISIYPNEQLSSGNQIKGVEMLLNGTTDIDMHSTMIAAALEPKLGAVSMPWLFPNGNKDVDKIVFNNGTGGKMIAKLMEAKGCHVLGLCENGFRQLTNNKRPVATPEDIKGLKIRIPSIPQYTALYKMLGTDPVTMSFSEVFTALQQGAIDGQENPYDFIRAGKIHEVQKYMTVWNYAYDPIILSCSSRVWKSLSDEDKKIFEEAAKNACAKEVKESRANDEKIIKEFKDKGMQITVLTPEQINAFKAVVKPVYEQFRGELTDEVLNSMGYKF